MNTNLVRFSRGRKSRGRGLRTKTGWYVSNLLVVLFRAALSLRYPLVFLSSLITYLSWLRREQCNLSQEAP